jgi:hypothetical protein
MFKGIYNKFSKTLSHLVHKMGKFVALRGITLNTLRLF